MKSYFQGTIKDGKLKCKEFAGWIAKNEGKRIEIFAEPITNKRSPDQNALWWPLICRTIAEHTGEAEWKIHRHLERELIPKDHITVKGVTKEIQKTCSELTKQEFGEFIEACLRYAAETWEITINLLEYDPAPLRRVQ